MYTVRVSRTFSAAHAIQGHGRCENVHGHNYRVEVALGAPELNPPGMVADFTAIRAALDRIVPDHTMLNERFDFNPTAENLARWFFDQLAGELPVTGVTVWENDDCCAEYRPG